MKASRIEYYERLGDQERARLAREFQVSDGLVPMTKGWERYHPKEQRIPVQDAWGNTRYLTPNQHRVLVSARSLAGTEDRVTMTVIANSIGVAVSTVSRALIMLAAFGLVAYDTTKGRYGGITLFQLAWADLKRRSRTAWAKIRYERRRAWDRHVSRLERSHYFTAGLNFAVNEGSGRNE